MSNLAKVICLLLVATATSGIDLGGLRSAQESFKREKESSTMKVEVAYENAKTTLDSIRDMLVSQIEIPYRPNCANNEGSTSAKECPSTERSQQFNERTADNNEGTSKCLQEALKLIEAAQDRLDDTRLKMIILLEKEEGAAHACEVRYYGIENLNFFQKRRIAKCIQKVEQNLPGIVDEAESEFAAEAENARKVGESSVPFIALCLAAAKNPMIIAE